MARQTPNLLSLLIHNNKRMIQIWKSQALVPLEIPPQALLQLEMKVPIPDQIFHVVQRDQMVLPTLGEEVVTEEVGVGSILIKEEEGDIKLSSVY